MANEQPCPLHPLIGFTNIYVLGAHCKKHMLGKDKAEVMAFLSSSLHFLLQAGVLTPSFPSPKELMLL